jgi:hypothetical protein
MPTKKPIKKIFEDTPIESADIKRELPESAQADATGDETSAEANPQKEMIEPSTETSLFSEEADAEKTDIGDTEAEGTKAVADDPQSAEPSAEDVLDAQDTEDETSTDDLLDDVRRSLIEAETDKEQKESSWWRRIGRKTKKVKPEETQTPVEIDLPPMPISAEPAVEQLSAETEEIDQIDDLIDLLKAKSDQAAVESVAPEVEAPSEPEPEIDFEELKKQAFSPRAEGEEPESITDVRSIALEGGEEVLVEVEAKKPDTVQERISAFENALKPYRQYIYIALAVLGVGMAAFASLIIYNVYQRSRPEPVKTVSNLPYPTGVSLPGGWSFQLGKGALENGEWNPRGPEWLEGTEVCRWVALPWSRQLEAVIRTLNPKDPIDLVMSNNDKFVYQVYSVKQLSPDELQQQRDSNTPCLLLILAQPDAEKRWVLTALP